MSISHNSPILPMPQRTLALTFGPNRLYLIGRREAPLWLRVHGPWQRPIKILWHRLEQVPGHWWVGQSGHYLVILGQGPRPALVLTHPQTAWQALVPSGHQSLVIALPNTVPTITKPVRAV